MNAKPIMDNADIEVQIYKEQQETKLLRLKYESILDGLDKQIDKLEGWIGNLSLFITII